MARSNGITGTPNHSAVNNQQTARMRIRAISASAPEVRLTLHRVPPNEPATWPIALTAATIDGMRPEVNGEAEMPAPTTALPARNEAR